MPDFRYDTSGNWYKGNTHIHSTASDGGKTFSELADMYASVGYDFLVRTDHWVTSDVAADRDDYPLLWLDGIELHGDDPTGAMYHVACIGTFSDLDQDMGLVAAMEAVREQGGILILAHPYWMGNSFDDALRWGFDGVEVYNHVCRWLNGKGDGHAYWGAMLRGQENALAIACDDAHLRAEHPGWNGGWIVVNAQELTRDALMASIRAGNFYASCGPEFHSIESDGTNVTVRTSEVQFARLVGPGPVGNRIGSFDGSTFTEASFEMPGGWAHAYMEIEDTQGRRALTNTLLRNGAPA